MLGSRSGVQLVSGDVPDESRGAGAVTPLWRVRTLVDAMPEEVRLLDSGGAPDELEVSGAVPGAVVSPEECRKRLSVHIWGVPKTV